MKRNLWWVTVLLVLGVSVSTAQFKSQVQDDAKISEGMIATPSASFLFGWFNPEKFHMQHSFSMSYASIGGQGVSLGTYTNSMTYAFSDKLDARADISMSYSPYNSFGGPGGRKGNDLSGIYLSRAQMSYRPWENVTIQLLYRQLPYSSSYYSPFYDPWYREGGF